MQTSFGDRYMSDLVPGDGKSWFPGSVWGATSKAHDFLALCISNTPILGTQNQCCLGMGVGVNLRAVGVGTGPAYWGQGRVWG